MCLLCLAGDFKIVAGGRAVAKECSLVEIASKDIETLSDKEQIELLKDYKEPTLSKCAGRQQFCPLQSIICPYSTLDLTRSTLVGKGTWCLLPTTPDMLPTATKHFDRAEEQPSSSILAILFFKLCNQQKVKCMGVLMFSCCHLLCCRTEIATDIHHFQQCANV